VCELVCGGIACRRFSSKACRSALTAEALPGCVRCSPQPQNSPQALIIARRLHGECDGIRPSLGDRGRKRTRLAEDPLEPQPARARRQEPAAEQHHLRHRAALEGHHALDVVAWKSPKRFVKRPARPYKSATQKRFTVENAKGA
jgi:hypothetical protein